VILDSASVETGAASIACEELVLSEFLDQLKQHCEAVNAEFQDYSDLGLPRAHAGGAVDPGN